MSVKLSHAVGEHADEPQKCDSAKWNKVKGKRYRASVVWLGQPDTRQGQISRHSVPDEPQPNDGQQRENHAGDGRATRGLQGLLAIGLWCARHVNVGDSSVRGALGASG